MTTATLRTIPLLAAVLLLALTPVSARAQIAFESWIAYEIREAINCNPGGTTTPLGDPLCLQETTHGFGTRIADATIVGGLSGLPGGVFDPATGAPLGGVTISASSIMSQVDWTGPVHGKFSVVLMGGQVLTGTLSGQLDLSLLRFRRIPLAPIRGHWRGIKGSLKAGGTFTGVFLLPFPCQTTIDPACYLLLGPTGQPAGEVPVQTNEFVDVPGIGPVPLVKLLVSLFTE